MSAIELLREVALEAASEIVKDEVNEPTSYEAKAHGGVWSIDYRDEFGAFILEDGEQISHFQYNSLTVTFVVMTQAGYSREGEFENSSMSFTSEAGDRLFIDEEDITVKDESVLPLLGVMVKAGLTRMEWALEAIEEDEAYDEQDYLLFKVAHS